MVLLAVLAGTSEARAGLVAYSFTGQVTSFISSSSARLGLTYTVGDPVSGQFVFDTASAVTVSTSTAAHYVQSRPSGFQLFVGPHSFIVGNYTISITDLTGTSSDQFRIQFSTFASGVVPINPGPLYVNGNPVAAGQLSVRFTAPSTTWSSTAIPTWQLTPVFSTGSGGLSGTSAGFGASFSLLSLTRISVPEPASSSLVFSSGLILVTTASRSRRRERLP